LPQARIVVVDHFSNDETIAIAQSFGAQIYYEKEGLGAARQICFNIVETPLIAFVDSDVYLTDPRFFDVAANLLNNPQVGAVVGMSLGHRLAYGLPAGLLVLRRCDFAGQIIPAAIDARETYFIQRRIERLRLKIRYVADCMKHDSGLRNVKPEWEGANTRLIKGLSFGELLFAFKVIVLLSFNNRGLKNRLYVPIFYMKFMRGFLEYYKWRRLKRPIGS
jgi:glycosyltransferase involved in cell wall biosynthesis